jgi:hypothetical protein
MAAFFGSRRPVPYFRDGAAFTGDGAHSMNSFVVIGKEPDLFCSGWVKVILTVPGPWKALSLESIH